MKSSYESRSRRKWDVNTQLLTPPCLWKKKSDYGLSPISQNHLFYATEISSDLTAIVMSCISSNKLVAVNVFFSEARSFWKCMTNGWSVDARHIPPSLADIADWCWRSSKHWFSLKMPYIYNVLDFYCQS